MKWTWVHESVVLAIHEAQLGEHGGPAGLRDYGLLESALARPRNLLAYGDAPDAASLAAAYAFGLASNHPFVDGNKRTAFVVLELFLELNGWVLDTGDEDCVLAMEALAGGRMSESALAEWVRTRAARR